MNAAAFNTALRKVMIEALNEGVFQGKLSPAEFMGIVHYARKDCERQIDNVAKAQREKNPVLVLPPNHGHLS